MTEIEEWRPIPEWPYAVSSFGNVRRIGRAKGSHRRNLKHVPNNKGYVSVHLSLNGHQQHFLVSRLVCRAFHGEPPNPDDHADHIDKCLPNCRADNLQWLTPHENWAKTDNPKGERHWSTHLKDNDVAAIRAAPPGKAVVLGEQYGVSKWTIYDIRAGRRWSHTIKPQGATA